MNRGALLTVTITVLVGASCTDRSVDEGISDEEKRIACEQLCERDVACNGDDPEGCVDRCTVEPTLYWDRCGELVVERSACLARVTCEEYLWLVPGGDDRCEALQGETLECFREQHEKNGG